MWAALLPACSSQQAYRQAQLPATSSRRRCSLVTRHLPPPRPCPCCSMKQLHGAQIVAAIQQADAFLPAVHQGGRQVDDFRLDTSQMFGAQQAQQQVRRGGRMASGIAGITASDVVGPQRLGACWSGMSQWLGDWCSGLWLHPLLFWSVLGCVPCLPEPPAAPLHTLRADGQAGAAAEAAAPWQQR